MAAMCSCEAAFSQRPVDRCGMIEQIRQALRPSCRWMSPWPSPCKIMFIFAVRAARGLASQPETQSRASGPTAHRQARSRCWAAKARVEVVEAVMDLGLLLVGRLAARLDGGLSSPLARGCRAFCVHARWKVWMENPPDSVAGSQTVSPSCGSSRSTMKLTAGRGAKNSPRSHRTVPPSNRWKAGP